MNFEYVTRDGRLKITFTAANDKDAFRQLSHLQEVFDDVASAKIGDETLYSDDILYRVRKAKYTDEKGKEKEAEYFEKMVGSGKLLYFKKSFGVLDDGSDNLFPKKADKEDPNLQLGYNGWHKYNVKQD